MKKVKINFKKIIAILEQLILKIVKEVYFFLEFTNYYLKFIKNYLKIIAPLPKIIRKEIEFR